MSNKEDNIDKKKQEILERLTGGKKSKDESPKGGNNLSGFYCRHPYPTHVYGDLYKLSYPSNSKEFEEGESTNNQPYDSKLWTAARKVNIKHHDLIYPPKEEEE